MSFDVFERYSRLDPAHEAEAIPDWDTVAPVLLATIDERNGPMQTQAKPATQPDTKPTRGRLIAAGAFAAVLVIAALAVGALQLFDSDDAIPVAGIEGDPAAAEAFDAVETVFVAYNAEDAEAWVNAIEAERTYVNPEAGDALRQTELANVNAAHGVDDRIEVTQCVSHGYGDWALLADAGEGELSFASQPVSTGYRFTCDAIHTNAFHDLAGLTRVGTYEFVVADGEIIATGDIPTLGWHESFQFEDDFRQWLNVNHEDAFWGIVFQGLSSLPMPDSAEQALEYAQRFVDESPEWPVQTSP